MYGTIRSYAGLLGARLRAVPGVSWIVGSLIAFTLLMLLVAWRFSPPASFPTNELITIPSDASARDFAELLYETDVIRSPFAFLALSRLTGLDRSLDPGTYVFREPLNATGIVGRVGHGRHGIDPVRVTLTEGMTTRDIADTFERELPGFDTEAFLLEASTSEGYLFPDTYFFMPGAASGDIVVRLRSRFSEQIVSITPDVLAFRRPFGDVVIMASLLEREAQPLADKRMVAGILWNRITKDMPLQVDAVFGYIHGENGYTPTSDDLELDSPYNTYLNKGLPPGPIANPGLEALLAAVTPTKTDYLYYLTGRDGLMHYAKTFQEHKENRALYLD